MKRNSEHVLAEWLVLNAQAGKAIAMDQLLKIWYPKFVRYSTRQLGSHDAAKDVVQDAMLTVVRKIKTLNDPVAFPKWAYRILHRRGVDYQRSEIRRRNRETTEADAFTASDEDDSGELLRQALNGLGEHSYNVIHLHYLHGLSLKEIAVVCGIPVGTVKSRLHAARGKIRERLEERS